MSTRHSSSGKLSPVRIGSGQLKGRKLLPPPGFGTRPMTGLAKKSIFGIITPYLNDAVVLDLYCGTGTLGIEAISNGASKAYFAEGNPRVVDRLRRNISECRLMDNAAVWQGDIERRLSSWLAQLEGQFDITFVDPPFPDVRRWNWANIESKIFLPLSQKISSDGMVLLRVPGDIELPQNLGGMELVRSKHYGDMFVGFYSIPG